MPEGGGYGGRKDSRMTVFGGRVVAFTLHQYKVDSIASVAFTDLSQEYNFVQSTLVESTLVRREVGTVVPEVQPRQEKRDQTMKSVHSPALLLLRSHSCAPLLRSHFRWGHISTVSYISILH